MIVQSKFERNWFRGSNKTMVSGYFFDMLSVLRNIDPLFRNSMFMLLVILCTNKLVIVNRKLA